HAPCGSPMTPPGLFGSLGPSLLAFTLHRPWSIGVNLSLNLHHAPSTAMSHPSPAHHKPRATSYATVLSITHHTKGANLPWFLSPLPPSTRTLLSLTVRTIGSNTRG